MLGPGLTRDIGNSGLVCEELDREVVVLCIKDVFPVQPFAVSKNWLAVGGTVSPQVYTTPKILELQECRK